MRRDHAAFPGFKWGALYEILRLRDVRVPKSADGALVIVDRQDPPAPPYHFRILNSHFFTDECPEPQDPNPVPSIELQPGDDINEVASRLPGMTWAQVLESTADQPE
jgi:hypothetical protein